MVHDTYCKPHQTLAEKAGSMRTTSAMAAGLTDREWSIAALRELLDRDSALRTN